MKFQCMVSILLATYNGEQYIRSAIDSVLNQKYTNFELLIGFNGTIDNSKTIVSSYKDPRIRIFDYGNEKGKAKTLNKLIKEAAYDFICLQDDDDIWIENKLEVQIPHMQDFDVVGTQINYMDENGLQRSGPFLALDHQQIVSLSMRGTNQVANTSAIFKKKDALEVSGWNENIDGVEDYDFWIKLMKRGKRFININEQLVLHRLHDNSNFNNKKYDISNFFT